MLIHWQSIPRAISMSQKQTGAEGYRDSHSFNNAIMPLLNHKCSVDNHKKVALKRMKKAEEYVHD
jgi:hypothetical protein